MTKGFQVTREAAFATAHVECLPAGRWNRRQKEVAMKKPVAVVARLSGPDNPGLGVLLPRGTEVSYGAAFPGQRAVGWPFHESESSLKPTADLSHARGTFLNTGAAERVNAESKGHVDV